jgi:hypothetical protein
MQDVGCLFLSQRTGKDTRRLNSFRHPIERRVVPAVARQPPELTDELHVRHGGALVEARPERRDDRIDGRREPRACVGGLRAGIAAGGLPADDDEPGQNANRQSFHTVVSGTGRLPEYSSICCSRSCG